MDLATAKPTRNRTQRSEVITYSTSSNQSEEFTVAQFQEGPRVSPPPTSGVRDTRSSTSGAPASTVARSWTTWRYRASTRAFGRCSTNARATRVTRALRRAPRRSIRWRRAEWRRPTRDASFAHSRSRSAPGRPFSSYGEGLLRRTVPFASCRSPCRTTSSSWTFAIASRFRAWMDEGLLEEVTALASAPGGHEPHRAPGRGISRTAASRGRRRRSGTCVEDAIIQSRRLARRQRSWFLRDPRIEWFDEAARGPRAPPRRTEWLRTGSCETRRNGIAIPREVARCGEPLPR